MPGPKELKGRKGLSGLIAQETVYQAGQSRQQEPETAGHITTPIKKQEP